MSEEYGPPILVNGKRPDWLGDKDWCVVVYDPNGDTASGLGPQRAQARYRVWRNVVSVQIDASHPYYQSAEYKASVGQFDETPLRKMSDAWNERNAIKYLEARGHTVTPPDPLDAGRRFMNGLFDAMGWRLSALPDYGANIPAAMEYLRANKGRL